VSLPVLEAWRDNRFQVVVSEPLLAELTEVCQRPRLKERLQAEQVERLLEQLRWRGIMVEVTTIPPRCRDIRDQPVLATAIDGQADAILTGDADLRADDQLRVEMAGYGVQLWGIETLLTKLAQ
jgi:putative PIN family toxin of toxin-antitoxin system